MSARERDTPAPASHALSPAGADGAALPACEDASELVLNVRLFAILRERAGTDAVTLHLPAGATVADALRSLARLDGLREPLARMPVVMAVNREYADPQTRLAGEDELALIPPLSGGSAANPESGGSAASPESGGVGAGAAGERPRDGGSPHVRISSQPLSRERLREAVADPRAGAVVIFEGVTREVERLDYEAYETMAQERIARIVRECASAHEGVRAIAAEHRVGPVALGEPSVIVAVSAAHRPEAFAAAREAIDRIKAEAPVWKREVGPPGAAGGAADAGGRQLAGAAGRGEEAGGWVSGTPPPLAHVSGATPRLTHVSDTPPPLAHVPGATPRLTHVSDTPPPLTHVSADGSARMVDVGSKPATERVARARARVRMSPASARAVLAGDGPKGEVLGVARLAGIQAAKQTAQLIPLAHPLALSFVDVTASVDADAGLVELIGEARTIAATGVEMEAMSACAVAALTVYDMVKGIERGVAVEQVVLLEKRGGRSDYRRAED